jgi:hypothetical protein
MAGLVPAIHVDPSQPLLQAMTVAAARWSNKLIEEIAPIGVCRENQVHLPGTRPVFDGPFTLNRASDIVVKLEIDQPL